MALTKSELIERITSRQSQLSPRDVELAVKTMIEEMADTLADGGRIEIRGFGSFSLHFRAPRVGRNPKTGASVELHGKYVPHFKPGKELRERVNNAMWREQQARDASGETEAGGETRNSTCRSPSVVSNPTNTVSTCVGSSISSVRSIGWPSAGFVASMCNTLPCFTLNGWQVDRCAASRRTTPRVGAGPTPSPCPNAPTS